jgi:hypothetical protein
MDCAHGRLAWLSRHALAAFPPATSLPLLRRARHWRQRKCRPIRLYTAIAPPTQHRVLNLANGGGTAKHPATGRALTAQLVNPHKPRRTLVLEPANALVSLAAPPECFACLHGVRPSSNARCLRNCRATSPQQKLRPKADCLRCLLRAMEGRTRRSEAEEADKRAHKQI